MRRVHALVALAVASSSLALSFMWTAVPADAGPPPLTASARESGFQLLLDVRWLPIAQEFPEAVQPDTEIIQLSSPENWDVTIAECYRQAGFAPQGVAEAWQWSVTDGLEERIARYVCDASYPPKETVDALLSGSELVALYDYYVEALTPCLELVGASPGDPPPDRTVFIQQSWAERTWTPVPHRDGGELTGAERRMVDALCPPEPVWLRSR